MTQSFALNSKFTPQGDQPTAIEELCQGINAGMRYQTLLGVTGSGKTFTIANVIQKLQKPSLILAHNKTLAAQLYAEMKNFFPHNAVEYFVSYYDYYQPEAYVAASDTYIAKDASINDQIEQLRLSATKSILERKDVIIVATVSAIYGLGDPQQYLKMIVNLRLGDHAVREELIRKLVNMQYKRNETDFVRGTFRVRGDVLDVFPAEAEDYAVRIELFDDSIENLTIIDALTGKVLEKPTRIAIYPKTHYVTPKSIIDATIETVKVELNQQTEYFESVGKLVERQRISERTKLDLEMMHELGYCQGIENYSRYLSGRAEGEAPPTLMDYLPSNSLVIIDESHVTIPQIGAMYKGDRSRKESLVNFGFRLPSALDNRPLQFSEFEKLMPQAVLVSATPSTYEMEHSQQIVEQVVRPTGLLDPVIEVRPVANQVDDLLSEINKRSKLNQRVLVTTLTKRMAEALADYLDEVGCKVRYLHSDIDTIERVEIIQELRAGSYDALIGINLLREGLDLPEVSLVAILDADKEGFLRDERSLIQTIGRAARNTAGKAILYADKITRSMDRAMSETERRRAKQIKFNQEQGITPTSIVKELDKMIDVSPYAVRKQKTNDNIFDNFTVNTNMVAEETPSYNVTNMTMRELSKLIKKLEKDMKEMASNLEFEKATKCRDEIKRLKEQIITV